MRTGLIPAWGLIGLSLFSAPRVEAQEGAVLIQGPVRVGNGFVNGAGTSLGRLFLKVRGLDRTAGGGDLGVSLEIPLTSSTVQVEPTTCAAPSPGRCTQPGTGTADVSGNPTVAASNFMSLKLAGAIYLPHDLPPLVAGSSFEVALEGTLNAGATAAAGAACILHLTAGTAARLLSWGSGSEPAASRPFASGTGTGILVSDVFAYTFPGRLSGTIVQNSGRAVLAAFHTAEIAADVTVPGFELVIAPDLEAAAAAGLPAGTFLVIETNYAGVSSRSAVFPDAISNDVEVLVTADPLGFEFTRGDCNADGHPVPGLLDAVFLLQFNFLGGPEPPCLLACDADGDGFVRGRVGDALYILNYAFAQGPAPPPPFPGCGEATPPRSTDADCRLPPSC